jgi:hypothetical protein
MSFGQCWTVFLHDRGQGCFDGSPWTPKRPPLKEIGSCLDSSIFLLRCFNVMHQHRGAKVMYRIHERVR